MTLPAHKRLLRDLLVLQEDGFFDNPAPRPGSVTPRPPWWAVAKDYVFSEAVRNVKKGTWKFSIADFSVAAAVRKKLGHEYPLGSHTTAVVLEDILRDLAFDFEEHEHDGTGMFRVDLSDIRPHVPDVETPCTCIVKHWGTAEERKELAEIVKYSVRCGASESNRSSMNLHLMQLFDPCVARDGLDVKLAHSKQFSECVDLTIARREELSKEEASPVDLSDELLEELCQDGLALEEEEEEEGAESGFEPIYLMDELCEASLDAQTALYKSLRAKLAERNLEIAGAVDGFVCEYLEQMASGERDSVFELRDVTIFDASYGVTMKHIEACLHSYGVSYTVRVGDDDFTIVSIDVDIEETVDQLYGEVGGDANSKKA